MHRVRGKKNTTPTLGTGRGLCRRSRPAGEGSRREDGGDRQREERNPGREKPGANRDLGTG